MSMGKRTKDQIIKILEVVVEFCGALLLLLPFFRRPKKKRSKRRPVN